MFDFVPLSVPGVVELRPTVHVDPRGRFVKLLHADAFEAAGLDSGFREAYWTFSVRGVVRGLHFQLPPHDHAKLVTCVHGAAFDAAVDLRRGSPAYGRHSVVRLRADTGNAVYIPRGVAHGFCVEGDVAVLLYMTTSVHAPAADTGVRWDSAGIDWPLREPIISERDAGLPPLAEFDSPFRYASSSAE